MAADDEMRWFTPDLDPKPRKALDITEMCRGFAADIDAALPESEEKTLGMRKLLEAKDCFTRAAIVYREKRSS